jgi:copper(I)-binding protein
MFRRRSFALLAALAVAAVALAGCGDDSDTTATGAASSGRVTVTDAWARTSAAGTTTGAAYMVITGGDAADRLVAAAAPTTVSKTTEIHETVMASGGMASGSTMAGMSPATTMAGHSHSASGGAMSMRPVTGIDVPAKGKVELKPGGYHVMFIDLVKPLAKGDTFTLSLTFEKAGKVDVPITVRDAA